jgi:hypothetical protein
MRNYWLRVLDIHEKTKRILRNNRNDDSLLLMFILKPETKNSI